MCIFVEKKPKNKLNGEKVGNFTKIIGVNFVYFAV